MNTISTADIQHDPLGWLKRVEAGETLLVIADDDPIAEIRPVPARPHEPRPFGLAAGELTVPDDFDAPLPDDVLRDFEAR